MKDFILPQHSRSYVGGGNISAILGISPFTTPLAAYHGIVNGDPEHDEDTLRFFKRRRALEPYAAAMLEERGFAVMRQNERYTHPDYPFLRAEVDAEVGCGDGVRNAEFKSVAPFASKVWGIDGSDDIPDYVMAQVQHGMSVTGRDKGAFALAVIGLDVSRVYPVQYDTDLAEMIHARAVRFWEDHVLKRVPPEPTTVGDILDFVAPDPTATRDARDLGIEQELLALSASLMAAWTLPVDVTLPTAYKGRKECRNSEASGIRPDRCGFFVPGSTAGRGRKQNTRKGNTVHRLASVSNLPATSRDCVETALRDFQSQQGVVHMSAVPIVPFNFESHEVRTVVRDGNPWFVATDVAEALGYRNASDAARHLDDDEKGTQIVRTLGGDQRLTIINESGLYAMVLRSRKPEARRFAKWVTSVVLPAIRKTGTYAASAVETPPSLTTRRWLISYDPTGKEQVQAVPHDACVMSLPQALQLLTDPDGPQIDTQLLADFIGAASQKLARRCAWHQGRAAALKGGRR